MRLITKLWATLLLLCVAGVANAATEYEVDQKFTTIAELDGKSFAIVDETPTTPTAMGIGISGHGNGWDMYFGTITEAYNSNTCFYKLEAVTTEGLEGNYYLRTYKADGTMYTAWGDATNMGYFNSQPATGGCCFALGLGENNGQDGLNLAVWKIEVSEGKFALKNIGTGQYLHADNLPAKYDDAFYFTFCTLKEKAQTDPLADQKDALTAAIAKGKMINALAYTDATFATLTAKVADGETALAAESATAESLTNATTAINNAIAALAFKEGFSSLQDVEFGSWTGWGSEAQFSQKVNPIWVLFEPTGQSYGDGSVNNRADVSAYDKLYIAVVSGSPRILLNRDVADGQWNEDEAQSHLIDNTKGGWSAKYFTTENGIVTVDLKQLTADKGFAHLTAIKSYDNNVISGLYLYKAPAVVPVDPTVVTWDVTTKNYENGTEIGTVAIDEKINAAFDKNTNSNAPKYYTTGEAVRAYGGNTITISGEKIAISKVEFTFGTGGDNNEITADKGTFSEGVWTIDENTNIVKFTIGGTTGNRRIVAIKVTYTIDENAAPLPQPVHIANTAETAYTVAQAIELIDAGEALSETVFVKGIISKVDKIQSGAINYWISADGTTEGQQFECYKGKNIDGADFAALEDVEVGAEVIVKGTLTKYGETYEFNQGNELVSYKAPFKPLFADGKYYIYNVGAQKYLAAGANWGTHAVVNATGLDYNIKVADGKYTIDSQVSNGGQNNFLNGEWNDGAAFGWTIAKVSDGIFTISDGTKFLTAGENGVVTLADDATAEAAQWSMKTLEARIAELATATAEAPIDATFLIQNANFGRNDLRKSAWKMEASNQNLSGGEDGNGTVGNNCAESYHSVFTLSQTLSNAPAGKYKMTAQGFYRQDGEDNENLPVFYANDKTATFPAKTGSENSMTDASKSFSAGSYTIEPIEVTVFEDGQLTVGAKLATNTNLWCIFDNFVLSYVSKDIPADEFAPAYAAALEAAQAALVNEAYAAVTGEEKTALEKAISDFATIPNTTDSVKLAISTLSAATTTFTTAKAAYESLTAAKAEKATLSFAYATAEKKAAAEATLTAEATSAADATAKVEAITKAYRQYAESSALLEGVEDAVNFTDAITNPAAEDAIAEPWAVVKGEGSGGALNILNGEPWTDGSDNSTHKYFDGGDWGAQAWNVALEQTISLPAGKYMLTAKGRASADVDLRLFAGVDTVKMASIGATGGLFDRGWNDASVVFVLEKDTTVTIGVRGITSIVHNWMSFSDFRLMQFPAHTWDFTNWSEATVANLKADAAASKLTGWSDVEKKADAEADAEPTEASKDNCFWATVTPDENGELSANGVVIEELKGLAFNSTYSTARSLAIAVNYPVALSTYAGPAYLWLGGGGKDVDCFVIKNVKAGTQIKMGVESHKTSEGRGVQLFVEGAEGARGAKLTAPDGSDVAVPSVYEKQTWAVPGEDGVCNIIVYNTKGCHIYFIDAEIGEPVVEPAAQEYKGYVAIQTSINGAPQGEATTAEQTLTITPIKDVQDSVAVTFSGFIATMPPTTFPEFTFNASVAANDSLTYTAATGSSISFQDGQMSKNYNLTGAGSATTKEDTPVFMIQLFQNPAMMINVVFAATEDGAKTALENYFTTTGISTVKTAVENSAAFNLNGQKVMKTQKGLYIINGKKVVIK